MPASQIGCAYRFAKCYGSLVAQTGFIVSRTDVGLLLAELREQAQGPFHVLLLKALVAAAQTLEASAPSQGATPTTTRLGLPAEHAEPFKLWLVRAAVRASRSGDPVKAAALKRIWESAQ